MSSVLVVGSGPSGVHLAQTLLDHGRSVTMLDVGHDRPSPVAPDADFDALKEQLDDPAAYLLGPDGSGIVFPAKKPKYFVHPPSKDYVFAAPEGFHVSATNFEPVISFAGGGLAEAWTAGVYALNDAELAEFPFDYAALAPYYTEVARRIGVTAEQDDLAQFCDWQDGYSEPVAPDPHTAHLLARYRARREMLNARLGFYLGRSRVAVLTRDRGERLACDRLGRCLWGCPRQALYAPSSTLRELRRRGGFRYVRGAYVTHFEYDGAAVKAVVASGEDGATRRYTADAYALAAGTLCSSKILLESIYQHSGTVNALPGLMDNSQFLMPFMSLGLLGRPVSTHAYQFHQLALGIERERADEYVHGQITTLKAASVHPVAQSLPFDLRAALGVFRVAHAALGAANVWLHDRRDPGNVVTIRPQSTARESELVLRCAPPDGARFSKPMDTVRRALRKLGCFVPPGMTAILPRGSSIHYAGTIPMQRSPRSLTCSPECRSHDFRNLYFADGATLPFLPAKNVTFTLMANAVRIADAIHRDMIAELPGGAGSSITAS